MAKRKKPKRPTHNRPATGKRYTTHELEHLFPGIEIPSWFAALKGHNPVEFNALICFSALGLSGLRIEKWLDTHPLSEAAIDNVQLLTMLARDRCPEYYRAELVIPNGYPTWDDLNTINLFRLSKHVDHVSSKNGGARLPEDQMSDKDLVGYRSALIHRVMERHDIQVFVVGEDLLEMLDHTDFAPPNDVPDEHPNGIHLPFSGLTLLFPERDEAPACAITIAVAPTPLLNDEQGFEEFADKNIWNHFFVDVHSSLQDGVDSIIGRAVFQGGRLIPENGACMPGDLLDKVTKILIVMNAEPEVIEPESDPYHEKSHPLASRPTRKKRPKTLTAKKWYSKAVYDSGGREMPTHWRRGHFRQQAYGKGRSKRKQIWLHPVKILNKDKTL